ncbi:MAG: preprotein translocase subunit SecE [Planctomycetes bacterium]|nr:preprotein translocase subunit SecE [Planctomycetota bacterium]
MNISFYKKGQGSIIRFLTWAFLSLMGLFGCVALYHTIPLEDVSRDPSPETFWGHTLQEIPFFDVKIRIGLIISALIFAGLVFLIYRLVINRPSIANFLIETEFELYKVSWPPRYEYWGSSVAVVVSVMILGIFLLVADLVLRQLMHLLKIY